ncbi:thioredoxin reductase [Candidatus Pacearchaeota archaeon]|nr:thioredoxin reductase [Candidatus Pacearchaeota archaeon]
MTKLPKNKIGNNHNKSNSKSNLYDIVIIGGGPAGVSAAVYSKRFGLKTLLITREVGDDWAGAHKICNYPGFSEISGKDLAEKFLEHVKSIGVEVLFDEIKGIFKEKEIFEIKTNLKSFLAKKVIFAPGSVRKKLEIKGESELKGRGVSYCANCDAPFFKNKNVVVVGGGNSAISAAILLAEHASKIYLIYRKSEFFRPDKILLNVIKKNQKIETIFNEELAEIIGKSKVEGVLLKNSKKILNVNGVFIEAGGLPDLGIIASLNVKTKDNYILTDENQKTNVEGFFAAGDIIHNEFKQIVVAASQGAIASSQAYRELVQAKGDKDSPLTQY